jgi:hypothetical protein
MRAAITNNEQRMHRTPPSVFFASTGILQDFSIFITQFPFLVSALFTSSLEVTFGRSPVPSENFAQRYREGVEIAIFDRGLRGCTS